MKRLNTIAGITLLTTSSMFLSAPSAHARTLEKQDLRSLAQQFVSKLSPKLPQEGAKKEETQETLSLIPDGEQLLFKPRIERVLYDSDILASKQNGRIYMSFYDLISVFEFPISYDDINHTGFGWFMREDWRFEIDYPNKTVTSKGKKHTILEQDIFIDNGELFIAEEALEQWFDMQYDLDLSQQYVNVESAYPLPAVAKHYRRLRKDQQRQNRRSARLPRIKSDYKDFDINVADITARSSYVKRTPSTPEPLRYNANIAVEGDALQHGAYALVNLDNNLDGQFDLSSVTARLTKEDEDPVLLGSLRARSYTIGDTNAVRLPLSGSATQELGFSASNNPLSNNDFETTLIEGDGLPGWDVELYRNGSLISTVTIDDTGRYQFQDIQLFGGDNVFELFFYGPQGEIRTENINMPVSEALLSTQNNTYEFSATLSNERTYLRSPSGDTDRGTPHIAGKYNFFLGDALSYVGFRSRQVGDDQKAFLGAGVTKIINNAIIDANVGVDDSGEVASELIARSKFKGWDVALSGDLRSDEYAPDETSDPVTLETNLRVNKNYKSFGRNNGNISANILHRETANGIEFDQQRLNLSQSFKRLNLSNSLLHQEATGQETRLENTLAARYNYGNIFMRGGVAYDIKPEAQVDRYFTQLNYRPANNLNTDLRLSHEPDRDFSEARLNVNYIHDNVRISPFIDIDSDDEIVMGLGLNSSIVHDDSLKSPLITSEKLIGRGMVSAFVYHDKNGDKQFNGDDEPLPDVTVESVNVKRRETTDERGLTLIRTLPDNVATDIRVDEATLPDPFMISANEGHSIFARASDIVDMEFPIHVAGEIDGVMQVRKRSGAIEPARVMRVQLIPASGNKNKVQTTKTAGDGFYVFSQVPPGDYWLSPVYDDLEKRGVGQYPPEKISIGYDGTVIYGKNIYLSESLPATNLKNQGGASGTYVLNIGNQGKSKLSGLLSRFMAHKSNSPVLKTLRKIQSKEGKPQYTTPSGTLRESFDACQRLLMDNMHCEIEQAMLTK